jgi:hypothetical protein
LASRLGTFSAPAFEVKAGRKTILNNKIGKEHPRYRSYRSRRPTISFLINWSARIFSFSGNRQTLRPE